MFETLVESGHRRQSPTRAGAIALALHIGIVGVAVQQTADAIIAPHILVPIDMQLYVEPAQVHPITAPAPDDPGLPIPSPAVELSSEPVIIGPISIDPSLPASNTVDLRRTIIDGARTPGFSLASSSGPTAPIDGILLAGEVDEPVRVLNRVSPRYPRSLEAAGITGRVVLQFVVDSLGVVEPGSLQVTEASDSAFAPPSRDAIAATRFAPARARGHAVRQLVRQSLLFTVR